MSRSDGRDALMAWALGRRPELTVLEALKAWTWWVISAACIGIFFLYLASFLPIYRDSTDGAWPHRSNLKIFVDAQTGCEYLGASSGGLTPRLNNQGVQMGCKP